MINLIVAVFSNTLRPLHLALCHQNRFIKPSPKIYVDLWAITRVLFDYNGCWFYLIQFVWCNFLQLFFQQCHDVLEKCFSWSFETHQDDVDFAALLQEQTFGKIANSDHALDSFANHYCRCWCFSWLLSEKINTH